MNTQIELGINNGEPAVGEVERAADGAACVEMRQRGGEDGARGAVQFVLDGHGDSVNGDVSAQLLEASLADAAHRDQMLDAAKRAVPLAMCDDARGETCADARQLL